MPLPRREPKSNLSTEVEPRYPEIVSSHWETQERASLCVHRPDGTAWTHVTERSAPDLWAAAHKGHIGGPEVKDEPERTEIPAPPTGQDQVVPLDHPDESDPTLEALNAERAKNADLQRQLDELKAQLPVQLPPNPSEAKLSEYIPAEIRDLMEPGESFTQARKRLSELLNVEKAELRLKRAAGSATDAELKREADVDRLQGLFSKLGEI